MIGLTPGLFRLDALSAIVGVFVCFFSILIMFYSLGFMRDKKDSPLYYLYIMATALVSLGAVFANNLLLFIVCWGVLGLLLYLLIGFGEKDRTTATAKKAFIIIGGTDAVMLLGLAFMWRLTGIPIWELRMDNVSIAFTSKMAVFAYLCFASGAFAKAGVMPFHSWIADTAEDAPTPVTAFLPASLDKLLGIYFLARISLSMFTMDAAMNTFLMAIGSITIIAAAMTALMQNDLKRLLAYCAVSHVGYIVLGIGTATPIGILGAIFYMVNHAIYKSCLFLSSGAVEKKARTTDLDNLGGLAKSMPVIFSAFLVASLAASGVPLFNGFIPKWMVYQGIIETAKGGGWLWIVWLIVAMFGSALTLAAVMKLMHSVFLGQPAKEPRTRHDERRKIGPSMVVPVVILAGMCIALGIYPRLIALIFRVKSIPAISGIWAPRGATIFLCIALAIGMIIYLLGTVLKTRTVKAFVGGESLKEHPEMRVSGVEFYKTIHDIGLWRVLYNMAEKGWFDIYEVGTKITFGINKVLRYIHNGVLSSYLAWCILGMFVLFYILVK